jgi:hydrogenase nickel incorporation protein HypB
MTTENVPVVAKIMNANDQIAMMNRKKLDDAGVFAINIMASPGSGKTSTILRTIEALAPEVRIAVVEGDTAPVTIDSDKVKALGIPAVQINTGGSCHLDAPMFSRGLEQVDLTNVDLLIIENVGNLICPAGFMLGSHANVVIASIPEGDDKPYKYPNIYRGIEVMIINKMDLTPYVDFDMDYFRKGVQILNNDALFFNISCKTGEGVEEWANWLKNRIQQQKELAK